MEDKDLQHAFDRYLNNQATPDEIKQLLNYFHLERESEVLTERVIQEMAKAVFTDNVILELRQPMYQRVQAALRARISADQHIIIPMWRKPSFRIAISLAASIVLICGYLLWNSSRPINMITVYASYGKQKEIHLPDSSKVWLNSGTMISYPEKFKGSTRTVLLKNGDAYFDVVHDVSKPFIVKTGKETVTVMGTSFEVNAYEKEREGKVTVSTGKVGIKLTGLILPALFILPGQQATITNSSQAVRITNVPVTDIAAWREHRLIFDEQPLAEVLQSLERKYNVHIEIKNDRLLTEKVSMRLNNQPLSNVLSALSFSKHFNYEIINDQLIVVK